MKTKDLLKIFTEREPSKPLKTAKLVFYYKYGIQTKTTQVIAKNWKRIARKEVIEFIGSIKDFSV